MNKEATKQRNKETFRVFILGEITTLENQV